MLCTVRPAAVAMLLLVVSGCETDPGPKATIEQVVPVSGTLTFQGTPLEHFQVTFLPTDGRRAAVGHTDAEGRFTLGTNDAGDGAPPGTHKVAVAFVGPPSTEIPGQEQVIDNPALLPQPAVKIPARYSNPETSELTIDVPGRGVMDLKIDLE